MSPRGDAVLKTEKRKTFKATLLALALASLPLGSQAAGVGRLTVMSALGQPLQAEIELTATRDEYASISARLASSDAFRNAGIEFAQSLSGLKIVPATRANGQFILQVSSERPFNDPFVDMLIEVSWAAGRLVREYTFLLDPPEMFKKPAAPAPVALPAAKTEAPAKAPEMPAKAPEAPAPAAPVARETLPPLPGEAGTIAPRKAVEAKPEEKPAAEPKEATRVVRKGDTLAKIAGEVKPESINLDQMLVALFRANQEAFDGSNMNRLRAGKILNVPDKDVATAVDSGEAHKIVIAQAGEFNAYRRKLAGMAAAQPAKQEAPKQAAAGKVTPRVEEKAPAAPAAGKDKLEVSRAAGTTEKLGARVAATEEELVARDKALKEANSRIAELEKNLSNLRKLAEMKAAAGAKPAAQEPAKAEPPKAEPAKVEAPKVEAPKIEAPVAAPPPAPPKPATPPPAPPKPAAPPPPPPSFVEENSALVFGGAGVLVGLLGYLGYGAWRRRRAAAEAAAEVEDHRADSVFVSSAAPSVEASQPPATDFGPDSLAGSGADEGVDPVAEADVYIAYGRDAQAEDILLEALKTDPARCAIHLKLLEIYAARKDAQRFEEVARELHALTGGQGPDWEKAAALGLSFDPTNPLYGGQPQQPEQADIAAAAAGTVVMAAPIVEEAPPAEEIAGGSLDFDLDLTAAEPEPAPEPEAVEPAVPAEEEVLSLDFDLDLGEAPVAEPEPEPEPQPAVADGMSMDFDIGDLGEPEPEPVAAPEPEPVAAPEPEPVAEAPAEDAIAPLDFDFDLGDTPAAEIPMEPEVALPEPEMPPLDLSGISLDLEPPPAEAPVAAPLPDAEELVPLDMDMDLAMPEAAAPAPEPEIPDDPEVATKLELALAYEEMGDREGARELLNEVLNEGSPKQQGIARDKLAQLG